MLQRRTIIAAAAALLFVAAAPVLCRRHRIPERHGALPRRHAARRRLSARAVDQGPGLATACQHLRLRPSSALEQSQLARIRAWSSANLTAARPTMFYMFSGPDFLYANAFYPNAKTYVLSGLEPVGTVPDLTTLRGSVGAGPVPAADFAELDPAAQLLHHQPDEVGSAPSAGSMARCRSCTYSWRVRARPSARSPASGSTRTAPCSRTSMPSRHRGARRQDRVRRQRRRGADAVLLQHRSCQRRRQQQQVPGLLRRRSRPATAS